MLRPGYVWHCPVRLAPGDRTLADAQWEMIAQRLMKAVGIHQDGARWIAVRHADDHIHLVATLVYEKTGRRVYPRNDFPKLRAECQQLEKELGLIPTPDIDWPAPAPRIKQPRYLDERPAEVEGRAVPGHCEGDLVIGKAGKTAVATLVERTSRFLILVPLTGRDSLSVSEAIIAAVGPLPATLKRSLTWDCGSEMALHKDVTATGLPVFFTHPHSPWERGSNENLNRIVREFLPKGVTILSDPRYLAAIAAEINDRPRKIHDWKKPSEVFTELRRASSSAPRGATSNDVPPARLCTSASATCSRRFTMSVPDELSICCPQDSCATTASRKKPPPY